jgi:hypothetical protein
MLINDRRPLPPRQDADAITELAACLGAFRQAENDLLRARVSLERALQKHGTQAADLRRDAPPKNVRRPGAGR